MNVSLTNELESFIDGLVASGMYFSASEVVRDGLRLLKDQEDLRNAKLNDLRSEILIGYEQSQRGESRPLDVNAIRKEGRRRIAAAKKQG